MKVYLMIRAIQLLLVVAVVSTEDCTSSEYNFARYYDSSNKLDLTTGANEVILRFEVSNTISAVSTNAYLAVKVENNQLIFTTTKAFEEYEKKENMLRITMVIKFTCKVGYIDGTFHQDLLEANNHDPTFAKGIYEATVPLPLPRGFNLGPFLNDGRGIIATDYDITNNRVEFTVSDNDYLLVESVAVNGNEKQFEAILKFKEQVLRLPGNLEVNIQGTDQGSPPRTGKTKVVIKPDLTIEYEDPPVFKQTFFYKEYDPEESISFRIELVPGTVHDDILYELVGKDAAYFEMNTAQDKSSVTVSLKNVPELADGKYFLSVIVQAKRSELQKAECVVLIDLKVSQHEGCNVTTVEKVLSTLNLEEEKVHTEVFPSTIEECSYEILSQAPSSSVPIFSIDESTSWIVSSTFDRENYELFGDSVNPQFQLVLQLNCSYPSTTGALLSEISSIVTDIPYSTSITHLSIIVEDINDNAPVFTFPKRNGQVFAFPVSQLVERLFLSNVLQVTAYDLDAGLNAVIRFSLTPNDNFGINPKTGIIYQLQQGLTEDSILSLDVFATDRDGSSDGLQSKRSITVLPALTFQISVLQIEGVEWEELDELIANIEEQSGIRIDILQGGYTCATTNIQNSVRASATILKLIVVAFDVDDELMSTKDFSEAMAWSPQLSITPLDDHLSATHYLTEADCEIYPYVVVMSVFIVLFIAACALVAFFYYKLRLLKTTAQQNQSEPSTHSDDILVENPVINTFSTPPADRKDIGGVTIDDSPDDTHQASKLVRSLSTLLEGEEVSDEVDFGDPNDRQRKKSIRFNEDVERIEVY